MSRVSLRAVRGKVQGLHEFLGNSIYAQWWTCANGLRMYVVFSYGIHWPLFIWHGGKWYANGDKYSVTTSRHKSAANPGEPAEELSCEEMKQFVHSGEPPPPAGIRRLLAVSPDA